MIRVFTPSLALNRAGQVYFVGEYDNSGDVPKAVLYPFPDPSMRNTRPEPWKVTLPEVNSLLASGEISLAS